MLFQKQTGTQVQFVPYRALAPAMQDLVAGQIDLMFDRRPNRAAAGAAGKIKAYAVTAKNGSPPRRKFRPSMRRALPGLHFSFWTAFWAPKGTPKDGGREAQRRGGGCAGRSGGAKATRGARPGDLPRDQQTPEALAALQKAEIEKWWPIIKAANIKGNEIATGGRT